MKDVKKNVREVIEKLTKYNHIGIRGVDRMLEIGQELDTSYRWDHDLMRSSYETDDPEELGGVCATNVFPDKNEEYDWYYWINDRGRVLLKRRIEEAIEFHKKTYSYKYAYIVAAENTSIAFPEDDREIILENAVVISRCY